MIRWPCFYIKIWHYLWMENALFNWKMHCCPVNLLINLWTFWSIWKVKLWWIYSLFTIQWIKHLVVLYCFYELDIAATPTLSKWLDITIKQFRSPPFNGCSGCIRHFYATSKCFLIVMNIKRSMTLLNSFSLHWK